MNISYVTVDELNIYNWSGIDYYLAKALEKQGAHLNYVDNLQAKKGLRFYFNKAYFKLLKETYMWDRDLRTVKTYANIASKKIDSASDIIFSPSTLPIAFLDVKKPKVFYHDATFAGLIGFYKHFNNLSRKTLKYGHMIEQQALNTCDLAIYSSDWAAQTALENYKVDSKKVKVVPFGANIEVGVSREELKKIVGNRSKEHCHLLFLGVDWERKGGQIALNVAEELHKRGLKVTLHIAGIKSIPVNHLPDYVVDHGFISKASQDGRDKLNKLLFKSHFLILPSKADCSPVVFSEANTLGLPCISTDVGGIPTIIKNGINGHTFSLSDRPTAYADFIQNHFSDYNRYERLAFSSFEEYEKRLNWNTAGKTIIDLLKTCL